MATGMPAKPEAVTAANPLKRAYRFLSSMQLGIVLLLALAAVSVFATTLEMDRAIDHIYRSWWFTGILAFTAFNLLLCTVKSAAPVFRQALKPTKTAAASDIGRMPVKCAIKIREQQNYIAAASLAFKKAGLNISVEEDAGGAAVVFGEKGKPGYFGAIVSHLSLLLILFGAMYGGLTGYEATNGGWIGANFFVPEGNFQAQITDIRMVHEENPVIRPRVYTDLTITRAGRPIKRGTVSINYPVRFEGNSIYHSTFIYLPLVQLKNAKTGETELRRFFENEPIYLDAQRTTYIQLMQFFSNFATRPDGSIYNANYRMDNPVAAGFLVRDNRREEVVFLHLNKPNIFETPHGSVEATLSGFELATVFSINKNLGRPFLLLGALLLIAGLYLSFFVFPCRFWAVYDQRDSTLLIGGRGYRKRPGIDLVMERIEAEITQGKG